MTASLGVTFYPDDSSNADELVRQADQAMYASKKNGKNRYTFFTKVMEESALAKLNLANHLRSALANNQFRVVYQPIVDLRNLEIRKAEALIRWHHPEMGVISPAQFVPIAEDTGLIVEIGEWVFEQAVGAIKMKMAKNKLLAATCIWFIANKQMAAGKLLAISGIKR